MAMSLIGVFFWFQKNSSDRAHNEKRINSINKQEFSPIVNQTISQWQTKTTEFFSIKFPRDWYWLENTNSGYQSQIITNNPNLDITTQYPDIIFYDKGISGRDDEETFITFYGRPTQEIDNKKVTTKEVVDKKLQEITEMLRGSYQTNCSEMSDVTIRTLKCSRFDNNQMIQSYYAVNRKITIIMIVRKNSITDNEDEVIDNIVQTLVTRED